MADPSISNPAAAGPRLGRSVVLLLRAAVGSCLDLTSEHRCAGCDQPLARRVVLCPSCAETVIRVAAPSRSEAPQVFAYAHHGGALAEAIRRFKYRGRSDLGGVLADLLLGALPVERRWQLVVPVPLHPRRLAARGYNQAALLAAPLARHLGARYAPDLLIRRVDGPPQAGLSGTARRRNLQGAFAARRAGSVVGRSVLLVDDVTTTGTTLEGCRRALCEAGAGRIDAVALTRSDGLD